MYEDHLRQKITNGHQAQTLLDDPLLQKVLQDMEEDIIGAMRIAPLTASAEFTALLKAKDDFVRRLETHAALGREAAREVERQNVKDRNARSAN